MMKTRITGTVPETVILPQRPAVNTHAGFFFRESRVK
jgi:hypothetical protein